MSIEQMVIENNPELKRTGGGPDWGRIGYWLLKFLVLAAMCAAVAGLVYGVWAIASSVLAALSAVDWSGVWAAIRRGFYSLALMAIFFYAACALRAIAKFFNARARFFLSAQGRYSPQDSVEDRRGE